MKRWALRASLPLALLLIPAPGSSAATCTAAANGAWAAPATWSCGAAPGEGDAVLIPAGKTVSVAAEDTESAGKLTLRGTLALGDESELDADGLAASGGTLSGPQYAMLVVTTDTGTQATVDGAGLTVAGAYLNVTGDGTLAVAGPLSLNDGGWVESDIDATWTGSAPWRIGGAAGSPASGFEVYGAQLTITGATSAQPAGTGGDGVIQLDGASTLVKGDATISDLGVDVLIDSAQIRVLAGRLSGDFQGAGSLAVAAGATLVLGGAGVQIVPPTFDAVGGTLEVEADADVTLVLPGPPALRRLAVGAGASLDVSIDDGTTGPVTQASPPLALGDEIAIASDAILAISGGGGTLALGDHDVLSGSGALDASLASTAGTVTPSGALRVTGSYVQGSAATLALELRSTGDADALQVDGTAALAGTLDVKTKYTPAKAATALVLAAAAKPSGAFTKVLAPLPAGRAWDPDYTAAGVALGLAAGGAPAALARPALLPAVPVVGGLLRCLPGRWSGAQALTYQWLRAGKPIARATSPRRRVTPADRGRALACRVTATATGGAHAAATSKPARARAGLRIGAVRPVPGGGFAVAVQCAAGERTCRGSLRVLVAGHLVARGRFAVRSPGGVARLAEAGAGSPRGGITLVRASYRNAKGAGREIMRRVGLPG